jgi:glycosyltransferase involved in cell wall biosynthesis
VKSRPEISVVLPYFNAETTMKAAAESILNQTWHDFELLLINNNSTDESLKIAESIAANDSRIRLLSETNPGVANAMNCGLAYARGKFIARMDADDIAYPERLLKQYEFLEKHPEIGFIGTEVKYVPHQKNTAGFKRFVDWVNSFHSSEEIEKYRFIEIPIVNPTIMFRRNVYKRNGGCFDGDFPEDYEMQLRYLDAGVKMAKLPEPLIEWHDYSTRLTRTDERYSTEAFFKTKALYFARWSEQNNPFHPEIWVWGAGRKTRQRSIFLEKAGLHIVGRIDILKSKQNAIFYENLPDPGTTFIISMVTKTGAREKIRGFLLSKKYVEGKDFILMA